MNEQREGFTFYRSYFDAIEALGIGEGYNLYSIIANYALNGVEPTDCDFDNQVQKSLWLAIFPTVKSNRNKWLNGKNGGCPQGACNNPHGRAGNKPETNRELTENKPRTNRELTENKAIIMINENDYDK